MQVRVLSSHVKQSSHAGWQAHDPQSTAWPQLFVTLPHLPAQVVAFAFGVQVGGGCGFFFFFFFFFFFYFCNIILS